MIRKEWKIRAGFVGFGEVNTPREFIDGRCKTAADELKKRGVGSLKVVFSKEAPCHDENSGMGRTPGSVSFVPPVAGMIMASEVVKDIIRRNI